MRRWTRFTPALVVAGVATLWSIALIVTQVEKYASFGYTTNTTLFAQALQNTWRGEFMVTDQGPISRPHTFFQEHFSPILLVLLPVYTTAKTPLPLLALQTISLAAAAGLLYLLALAVLGRERGWLAALIGVLWLIHPKVVEANLVDFYMDGLMPALAFGAGLGLVLRRWALYWIFVVLLLATKEDAFLHAGAIGLWALLGAREVRHGILTVAVAAIYGVVVLGWVIPSFAGGQTHPLLGWYGPLGTTGSEIIRTTLFEPGKVLGEIAVWPRPRTIALLLASAGGMPIAAGWAALLPLPAIAEMTLSAGDLMYLMADHYAYAPVALTFMAGVIGIRNALSLVESAGGLVRWAVWVGIAGSVSYGFVGSAQASPNWEAVVKGGLIGLQAKPSPRDLTGAALVREIPRDGGASVCTDGRTAAHLTDVGRLPRFPDCRDADYVVLDVHRFWGSDLEPAHFYADPSHYYPDPAHYASAIKSLLRGGSHGVLHLRDGWVVARRGAPSGLNAEAVRYVDSVVYRKSRFSRMGREVHHGAATVKRAVCSAKRDRGKEGMLLFGPYLERGPGGYVARVHLSRRGTGPDAPGARIDVTTDAGRRTWAEREVRWSDIPEKRFGSVEVAFEIPESTDLEIRVRKLPGGDLCVDEVMELYAAGTASRGEGA